MYPKGASKTTIHPNTDSPNMPRRTTAVTKNRPKGGRKHRNKHLGERTHQETLQSTQLSFAFSFRSPTLP